MTSTLHRKVILVGWDDRERARDALALAGVLARELGLGIRLAHVCESYPSYPPYTDLTQAARDAGQEILDNAPLGELEGVTVEKALVTAHSPSAGLHQLADGADVEMVVLGSTHRSAIGRAVPGTVAHHLLHGCPCAVAIAPAGYVQRHGTTIATVAAAFDGSPEARAAVEEATRIAQAAGAKLRIVSVIEPSMYGWAGATMMPPSDITSLVMDERRRELDEVVANRPADVDCEDVLREGPPVRVLCDEAKDADLLVMGSRGYGPLRSVLVGSVSSGVAHSAGCPVVVLPRSAITASGARQADEAVTAG